MAVGTEMQGGTSLNHQRLQAGADRSKLPRTDKSGGLDQRFMNLIVARWVAKGILSPAGVSYMSHTYQSNQVVSCMGLKGSFL